MKHDPTLARHPAALPLLTLALIIAVSCVVRGAFGTVQEAAKAELGLDDLRLGLVQGLAMSIPIAALSIPLGRMVDRASRMRLLTWMAAVWSAGSLLTAFAYSFPVLFIARMMAGLGSTCAVPAAISLVADLCRPERRGRGMLVVTIGQWAGIAAGFALCGALFGWLGHGGPALLGLTPWRGVHLIVGIASTLLIAPTLLMREPARHELGAGEAAPFAVVMRELLERRRFLVPLFVGQVGVVMADAAAGIWVAPVLTRSYGLSPDRFGGWVGAVIFGSGVVGSLLGGMFADLGQRSARPGGILLSACLASVLAVPAALFPVMPGVGGFAAMLTLLLLCGTLCGLVTATAITVLLPNELRGVCLGAFVAVAGMIGFGLAPTLVTAIAGLLGGEARLGEGLAIVGVAVGLCSTVSFWIAMRHAPTQAIG